MKVRYQPIQVWPHAPTHPADREVSKFSAGYNTTLDELEAEIGKLDGSGGNATFEQLQEIENAYKTLKEDGIS